MSMAGSGGNPMGNMMSYTQGMQQQMPNTTTMGVPGGNPMGMQTGMQTGPGMQSPSQQQQTPGMQQGPQQQQAQGMTLQGGAPPTAATGTTMMTQGAAPGQGQFNIVSLCKFGQETVQDIVSRFQEVFQALRVSTPPNGTATGSTEKKVQEQFRTIRLLFKRVRILYDKCNDSCQQGMEYTHVESLIPLKDEPDHKPSVAQSEEYQKALQDNRELLETVMLKNKQLREVIDRIRIIIWEINTMLSMRKS
uniref:Mediator of RNA polymerase II transcription subunit 30 n=1 Tax=Nyssomyia neivai TaxID=330878 RepID=A0A1L8DFS5_9DIPT